MKTIAILAVLVGALELWNTLAAAAAAAPGGRSATGAAIIVVTVGVSGLLLVSGVALLVRGRRAITLARVAAFVCLVLFATLAAMRPGFSIGSLLLGIAFPIVMLLFLRRQATFGAASATS